MSAIRIPDALGRFVITTLSFEDLASFDGQELGSAASLETVLEEDVFHEREGYAGMTPAKAEIEIVRIVAASETFSIADDSVFYIDDLSFGRELKASY